jgi:glycosyltransferase involved in cell wall biosynthesis
LFHALLPFAARRIPHDLWIENFTPPFSTSFLPLFSPTRVMGLVQNLSGVTMSRQYWFPFFLVERFGLRFYRDVVALNAADGALVRRYSPNANVSLIPNGVDQRRLDEQLLGHGEHILYLGRIEVYHKGLDLLLAAYDRSGLAMPLLVAGRGTRFDEKKLQALLATTRGDVRWLGHVAGQQKHELLERSAFMVMPSRQDTYPLSALEGMTYGKPMVHFDLPTLRWIEGDVRIRPFDVGAFASEMRDLAGDERARRELGRAAHAAAQQSTWENVGERYLTLVRQLLDAPGAGRLSGGGKACR